MTPEQIAEPVAAVDDLRPFLAALWQPGDVREVRIPKYDGRRVAAGWFDDPELLAAAVGGWDGQANLYVTLNPVNPALLARAANRINPNASATTADADIIERRWLLVDIDPKRPAGISATDDESQAARDLARSVRSYLTGLGWPAPIVAMTGNGYALLYPIVLANDPASTNLVAGVLGHLAAMFDDDRVTIDVSVSNAARIGCLVGSMKVKGDTTPDRPHRRSGLVAMPDRLELVPTERLVALVPATNGRQGPDIGPGVATGWVREWLDRAGVRYREKERGGITWYRLDDCPFHPGEGAGDCGVGEAVDGKGAGKCFHNRGSGKTWHDFRSALGLGPPEPTRLVDTRSRPDPEAIVAELERGPAPVAHPSTPGVRIGTRTAIDLLFGSPPDQLVDPFLTPEGSTILYGKGGVGKGVLTCWLIKRLVEDGHIVLVVDFEGHEREWGSRLRGLGLADEHLGRIHYRAPFGDDWTAKRGSLFDVAQLLRDERDRIGATYLVVDSFSVATSTGDTMGGSPAAQEYFGGLSLIGLPSLTIAHVRGDSGRFSDRPFGSVFVHNLARETWVVEQLDDTDEGGYDPDLARIGPHVVALELRNKKANGRAKSIPQFVTFSFFDDDTIEVTRESPAGLSLASLSAAILTKTPALTTKAIAAAIKEDTGRDVAPDEVRRAMKREPHRFATDESMRPHKWTVS